MKALEERRKSQHEAEYEETNYAEKIGESAEGLGGRDWKRLLKLEIRRPDYGPHTRSCYVADSLITR